MSGAFVPFAKPNPLSSKVNLFDKVFEDEGPLGKGITVGKVQIALLADDHSSNSIFGMLERKAKADGDTPYALARMCYDVCMSLLRKEDDWISASSTSQWFKGGEAGKAESTFNTWADKEAAKFEKVSLGEWIRHPTKAYGDLLLLNLA